MVSNAAGFEVDFLPVGNGSRSGDAIALRYGSAGEYKTLVFDGGTKEAGLALVDHIKKYYATTRVDYVVNSHPDTDHASGLLAVLEHLEVGELWMHQPWNHSSLIRGYFRDGRITDDSLSERLRDSMAAAFALEQLAEQRGIPIYEPFRGAMIDNHFLVLSPEENWYVHELICEFQKSPEQKKADAAARLGLSGMYKAVAEVGRKAVAWVAEEWGIETLREDGKTSSENESSVVLYGQIDGKGILLTGDAGIRALTATADFAEANGLSLPNSIQFAQVPHHGGRRNVSPSVLDRIIGQRRATPGLTDKVAFVSASKESTTHPRKAVVNAFIRRGANVIATQGEAKCFRHNMDARAGWFPAVPLTFSNQVEAWE
ncbi:MAG: ComEC/Rec2 family competence protein [Pyrinomonadaceae bacterium]